jgi:hypothetical protein
MTVADDGVELDEQPAKPSDADKMAEYRTVFLNFIYCLFTII